MVRHQPSGGRARPQKSAKATPHGPRRKWWSKRARCPRPKAKKLRCMPCRLPAAAWPVPGCCLLGARPRRRHQGACMHGAACMRGLRASVHALTGAAAGPAACVSTRSIRTVRSPGRQRGRRYESRCEGGRGVAGPALNSQSTQGAPPALSRAHQSGPWPAGWAGRVRPPDALPCTLPLIICHCDARRIGTVVDAFRSDPIRTLG